MAFNSDHFNLTNWKLTLPVDITGGTTGFATEIKKLAGYDNPQYFWDAPNGDMVFHAMVDGATTSGSHYARSELREMNGTSLAAWHLSDGGTMSATLKVDEVPTNLNGTAGRMVIGQIHGASSELVRLYYDAGHVYFMNDQSGADNKEHQFNLTNAKGEQPNVSIGEEFSYMIDTHGGNLTVKVIADGQVYSSSSTLNPVWQTDSFYFKAGVYLGLNETNGKGEGQDSFHALDFSHAAGGGMGGWDSGAIGTVPTTPPSTEPASPMTIMGDGNNNTLVGDSGSDTISGGNGNDIVYGKDGNDVLWGNNGNDTLIGGVGADTLKGGDGSDTFVFTDIKDAGDSIADFRHGEKIDISGIVANNLHLAGSSAAALIQGGFLALTHVDSTHDNVSIDVDGAAGAGAAVLLANVSIAALHPLLATDFIV